MNAFRLEFRMEFRMEFRNGLMIENSRTCNMTSTFQNLKFKRPPSKTINTVAVFLEQRSNEFSNDKQRLLKSDTKSVLRIQSDGHFMANI